MTSNVRPLFGVSEYTTWPWTFEQDIAAYARLGVKAIEICEAKLDPARAEEQLALVKSAGMTISSVQPRLHSLFPDQPRPEPEKPEERMLRYHSTIDLFGRVAPNVTLVTISGAAPGGDFRHAFELAVKEYSALADYAADHGVRIALEPLNPILMNVDSFICTIPGALKIIDAVNRPNFGIWIDVWHIFQDAAAVEHIKSCGDRIFGVHVNDWRTPRHFGDRYIVGQGEIDLPPLLKAIDETGYNEAYTLEIFSSEWLDGSLWKGDMNAMIALSREGFERAWASSSAL